jgi:hypothetical protein
MLDKVRKLRLPGTGRLDYAALVSEPKAGQYVAEFMIKTGLLINSGPCSLQRANNLPNWQRVDLVRTTKEIRSLYASTEAEI